MGLTCLPFSTPTHSLAQSHQASLLIISSARLSPPFIIFLLGLGAPCDTADHFPFLETSSFLEFRDTHPSDFLSTISGQSYFLCVRKKASSPVGIIPDSVVWPFFSHVIFTLAYAQPGP